MADIKVLNARGEEMVVINAELTNPTYRGPAGPQGPQGDTGLAGKDGKQGPKGDTGPAGQDGYTPIRGVDYWTEEDKAEIIASIPTGENKNIPWYKLTFKNNSVLDDANEEVFKLVRQHILNGDVLLQDFGVIMNDNTIIQLRNENGYYYFYYMLDTIGSAYYRFNLGLAYDWNANESKSTSLPSDKVYFPSNASITGSYSTLTDTIQLLNNNKLDKADVPNLENIATITYVDEAISTIELTPGPAGKDGQDGKDYVLTDADKQEIAGMVEVTGGGSVAIDGATIIENEDGTISTAIGGAKVIDVPATEVIHFEDEVGKTNGKLNNGRIPFMTYSECGYVNPLESWDKNSVYNVYIEAKNVVDGTTHSGSGQFIFNTTSMWNAEPKIKMDGYYITNIGYTAGTSETQGFYLIESSIGSFQTYQVIYITKIVITKPATYKYSYVDNNFLKLGEGLAVNLADNSLETTLKGLRMWKGNTIINVNNTINSEDTAGHSHCVVLGTSNTLNNIYNSQGAVLLGSDNKVCGNRSMGIGYDNRVECHTSAVFGFHNNTSSRYNQLFGESLVGGSQYQMIYGQYNLADERSAYKTIIGNGTSATRANGLTIDASGNVTIQGTVSSAGADYAEYFEWVDGNPNREDRVGLLVTLLDDKIRLAQAGDDILGVVSGTATVLGDDAEWVWQGKYVRDDFGRIIMEEIDTVDENNEIIGKTLTPKINPEYDENQEYIPRAKRAEWDAIGMMGKLYVKDNGSCVVGGYATIGKDGIATHTTEKTNMKVMTRISDEIVRVLLK